MNRWLLSAMTARQVFATVRPLSAAARPATVFSLDLAWVQNALTGPDPGSA